VSYPVGARAGKQKLQDADYAALARFRYALRVFLAFSEQAAREAGLTPSQHQLLLAVRGFKDGSPPAIGDLAESLQIRHHSAVELVDRVQQAGLVRRIADPNDGRRQLVQLTPKGKSKLEQLTVLHREELARFRTELAAVMDILPS
jgi:DNA-binding MarR family transcriptional regulator